MKVTKKQDLFCRRYLIDFNATKAAIAIGFAKKSARQQGYRLLTKDYIQAHIEKLRTDIAEKYDATRYSLMEQYAAIRDFDIRKLYEKDGTLKPIHKLTEEEAAGIASIEVDEIFDVIAGKKVYKGVSKKVKRWDRLRAIDGMARMQGYGSSVKISGTGTDDKGNTIKEFKVTLNL